MGTLIARRQGGLLTLELGNPGKGNALDLPLLGALDEQVRLADSDDSVRALVLRGSARGSFSSGADIRAWAPMAPDAFARDWIAYGNAVFDRLARVRCPTVAVIEGVCFGGGLELALCCDLRIGTTAARLRLPEVAIGAIPGWQGGARLERIVGRGRALEAVLLAREIDAPTAHAWGVLNTLCEPDDLHARTAELTDRLCAVSPRAAALAKSLVVGTVDATDACVAAARAIKSSRDAEVGIRAFIDKKTPVF